VNLPAHKNPAFVIWGGGYMGKLHGLLPNFSRFVNIDPLIAAVGTTAFAGADRSYPGPLDGSSVTHYTQLRDKVNGFYGIDMPYFGSLDFIKSQLIGAFYDLFHKRDMRLIAEFKFWHTTRAEKWLGPLRAFFEHAERLDLGVLTIETLWHEGKPIATTRFVINDEMCKNPDAACEVLDSQLADFVYPGENTTLLYPAVCAGSAGRDVALPAAGGELGEPTRFRVKYSTATTGLSSAAAYHIGLSKGS